MSAEKLNSEVDFDELELNIPEGEGKSSRGTLTFDDKVKIAKLRNENPKLKNKEIVAQVLASRTDLPDSYMRNPGTVVFGVKAYLEGVVKNQEPANEFKALQEAGLVLKIADKN